MLAATPRHLLGAFVLSATLHFPLAAGAAVQLEQIEQGGGEGTATIAAAVPVDVAAGDLLLVAIATRTPQPAASIDGLGLEWSLLASQCAARDRTLVEVWSASSDQAVSGVVTATLVAPTAATAMLVSRYSGVDPDGPIGAVAAANQNGPDGNCAAAIETDVYAVDLDVIDPFAAVYGAVAMRNKQHAPGSGFTERGELRVGADGDVAGLAVQDRELFAEDVVVVDGTLSREIDWAAVAVELRPFDAVPPPVEPSVPGGIWISPAELAELPVVGTAWEFVKAQADGDLGEPNVAGFNADHDVNTLAAALVYGRTGLPEYRHKTAEAIMSAIGTEVTGLRDGPGSEIGAQAVTIARNLVALVIAADLINLEDFDAQLDAQFRTWIDEQRSFPYNDRSVIENDIVRANNHGRMAGAARLVFAIYLGDQAEIDDTIRVFKGILGDRSAHDEFDFPKDLSWQEDPARPLTINAVGAMKQGISIDGALPEEMRRGCPFQIPPCQTGYPWEGLQGILVEAVVLARRGHDVWNWSDQAIRRAAVFLDDLQATYPEENWWARGDDKHMPWLINFAYGTDFPMEPPEGRAGKNMGWTDWTHADGTCRRGSLLGCEDGDACTDDLCDAGTGACTYVLNTAVCDDGNACTTNDTCSDGICAGDAGACCGNADGAGGVTAGDALLILQHAVGLDTACPLSICDANSSGAVTTTDVLLVLQFAVGLDVPLACSP